MLTMFNISIQYQCIWSQKEVKHSGYPVIILGKDDNSFYQQHEELFIEDLISGNDSRFDWFSIVKYQFKKLEQFNSTQCSAVFMLNPFEALRHVLVPCNKTFKEVDIVCEQKYKYPPFVEIPMKSIISDLTCSYSASCIQLKGHLFGQDCLQIT